MAETLEAGGELKKYHVALFVTEAGAGAPTWTQVCKSTDNTITLNAQTAERDFIVDHAPTTIIERYSPSLSEPLTLVKGESDYDFFWKKFYELPVGTKAKGKMLIVFYNDEEKAGGKSKFKSWLCNVLFTFDNLNPVDGTLTVNTNINGTITKGTCEVAGNVPTFTAAA